MDFSLIRLGHLLKKDFFEMLLKTIGIISLIFAAIVIVNLIVAGLESNGNHQFDIFYTFLIMFFIGCSIIGSISFEQIKKRPGRIEYLTLPALSSEKTLSKFILVAIAFPILMVILYYTMYGFASGVGSLLTNGIRLNNQPDEGIFILITVGSILTSIFAYGSIKYSTNSFPKIIVWGFVYFFIFVAISFLIAFMLFPEIRAVVFGNDLGVNMHRSQPDIENHWTIKFAKSAFYFVPLIFWTLTYFTLKEKEA